MRNPVLEERHLGRPVRSLQQMLRTIHFADPSIPIVTPNGTFDERTEQALRMLQRKSNLPVTGEADYDTWVAMVLAYQAALDVLEPARLLQVILQRDLQIQPGERQAHLYLFQAALMALGLVLDVPPLQVTGVHDRASVAATRWLQKQAGLKETGVVDRDTWDAVSRLYPAVLGDGDSN